MSKNKIILGIVSLLVLIVVFSAAFVVDETKQVIITQFGKPVGDAIIEPGIHFKLPLVQDAHFFEKRFLEWDGDANQVPTSDKRFIWVDTYARWRISDPLLFFQRVRDERGAQTRLDDILEGETRNAIARYELVEIVRNTNRTPMDYLDSLAGEYGDEGDKAVYPKLMSAAIVSHGKFWSQLRNALTNWVWIFWIYALNASTMWKKSAARFMNG